MWGRRLSVAAAAPPPHQTRVQADSKRGFRGHRVHMTSEPQGEKRGGLFKHD